MEFKGTKGKWTNNINEFGHITSVRSDEANRTIFISKVNNTFESNANMVLATHSKEMFDDIKDLIWLSEQGATLEEIIERLQVSKQLLTKITE
jgi:uncharacterized FlgJ-related protein